MWSRHFGGDGPSLLNRDILLSGRVSHHLKSVRLFACKRIIINYLSIYNRKFTVKKSHFLRKRRAFIIPTAYPTATMSLPWSTMPRSSSGLSSTAPPPSRRESVSSRTSNTTQKSAPSSSQKSLTPRSICPRPTYSFRYGTTCTFKTFPKQNVW